MDSELAAFLETLRGMEGFEESDLQDLARLASGEKEADLPPELQTEDGASEKEVDIRAKISGMNVPQRLKLAMFGNSVCRQILVMDSSRLVQQAVLNNPRLTEGEVEAYSKNQNLPEHVLRLIGTTRGWVKSYLVKLHLVMNPRTPQDVALKWLRYLRRNDLRRAAKSKNIPSIVAVTARKIVASEKA